MLAKVLSSTLLLAGLGCAANHATSSPPDGAPVDGASEPTAHGLHASYFADDFTLAAQRIDATVDFAWGTAAPADGVSADRFTVRWTGLLEVPADGTYAFALDADDGARLWIDGTRVIDAWKDGTNASGFVDVPLTAGRVPIKITYYDQTAAAHVQLRWRLPDGTEQVVPTEALWAADVDALGSPAVPYHNAIEDMSCADPGVLHAGDWFYLGCTGGRFRLKRSRDLVHWTDTSSYILPAGGTGWSSTTDYRWAPELHTVGAKTVAYFVSADGQGKRAIGAAVADAPLGPYTQQAAPLVTDAIGAIDPSFFEDTDGKRYLLWKIAGNSVGQPTPIYLRELAADGLHFAPGSTKVELIRNAPATWEGPLVEAPWLVKHDGMYYLFYSGNFFNEKYRVGVARAASVAGPYTKKGAPILGNNAKWVGPGHNSVVQADGLDYIVYHAWPALPSGQPDETKGRLLMVDRITWANGWPVIDTDGTPSMSPRVRPGIDPDADAP